MIAQRPRIVCLCGSTDFMQAFQVANLQETLEGKIVLSVGCDTKSDAMLDLGPDVKTCLDELHLRKIDLADEILVLNVGGYIGTSTSREICYANEHGKFARWLEPVTLCVFSAADQGVCDCCDQLASWLRFDPSADSWSVSGRCSSHAWIGGVKVKVISPLHAQAEICPLCGAVPVHGLVEVAGRRVCGKDCPGQDSGVWCDHRCVGAVIRDSDGNILMFDRGTYPFAVAGPAGHCDGDVLAEDALVREVSEEVGLQVVSTRLLTHFFDGHRCRRRFAGQPGHYWRFYEVEVAGELRCDERETKTGTARWYTRDEIGYLMDSTREYLDGDESVQHLDLPWYSLLDSADLGLLMRGQ